MKAFALVCVFATIIVGISATDSRCKYFTGDGRGGSEIWVGKLSKQHCIDACIKRKREIDDSINGITVYSGNYPGCWCESGMTYRNDGTTYASCFLEIPDPKPNVQCALYYGDGEGGGQVYLGKLTRSECVDACIKRKNEVDDSINGVTVYANIAWKSCYCEKRMTYRDTGKKWKSCFLRVPDVNPDKKCALFTGDGKGGSEIYLGKLTRSECIAACIKRKNEVDDLINGVTVYSNSAYKRCYCEKGMKWRNGVKKWKSCFLRVPDPNANKECELQYGDGEGGMNTWLGPLTRSECIETCIKRKKTLDDSINGVLVYANEATKGCYCEKAMTYRDDHRKWKSCILRNPDPCGQNNGGCEHVCTNVNGVAKCSCKAGYNVVGSKCRDIDECTAGTSGCSQQCINTDGSYKCSCSTGYKLGKDGKTCEDTDECTAGTSGCSQQCINTDGSYKCLCSAGYELGEDGKTCEAVLRCKGKDHGCCTADKPCQRGDGDCDSHDQCAGNLVCGVDNCPWGDEDDCCTLPSSNDVVKDVKADESTKA